MKHQQKRRKCLNCGTWFVPDARNVRHQRYCSEAACRQASKAASQRQWLAKPENRDYFRGAGVPNTRDTGVVRALRRPLRYKMTAPRKSLKYRKNRRLWWGMRYKMSCRRNRPS
ncbi:hypothetical protein AWB78_08619 [Caballeronia calidae]|uniref:Uncharacterized protein n=1 Tax=Caballeronia calidae TaxID=1777139 RepID=A0A158EL57_9BURK|nr:hypothetical protein [Caballeronia calidae]SAL07534.1 hypothetical protein AWB78_08619 [Caballeronia calidae]